MSDRPDLVEVAKQAAREAVASRYIDVESDMFKVATRYRAGLLDRYDDVIDAITGALAALAAIEPIIRADEAAKWNPRINNVRRINAARRPILEQEDD